MGKAKPRLRRLVDELARVHPHLDDPEARIRAGEIVVGGIVRTSPDSRVPAGVAISLRGDVTLRGERKLAAALDAFGVDISGRVALDLGAAAGGFTCVLLRSGARRVYAIDAGYGQLLGALRADDRVVSLERTNLGALTRALVPEPVEVVTIDLSYLSLARAVPQLASVEIAAGADAIALVKPQFELGLPRPPVDDTRLREAVRRACEAFTRDGWRVVGWIESPVRGAHGSVEFLVHATTALDRAAAPRPT